MRNTIITNNLLSEESESGCQDGDLYKIDKQTEHTAFILNQARRENRSHTHVILQLVVERQ